MSPLQNTTTEIKMKHLDILPLSENFKYNKATLIHKIYHDKTPQYLNEGFNRVKSSRLARGGIKLGSPEMIKNLFGDNHFA